MANSIIPTEPLTILDFVLVIITETPSNSPNITVKAVRLLPRSLQLRFDKLFKAADNIITAMDMPIITVTALVAPLNFPSILLNNAIEPTSSPNNIVIAPIAEESFSGSMNDKTTIDAANIPTATAIDFKVSAFNLFWYSSRQPLNELNTSVMFFGIDNIVPKNPLKSKDVFLISLPKLPKKFLALMKKDVNNPAFRISISVFKSPCEKTLPKASPITGIVSLTFCKSPSIIPLILSTISAIPSKPFISIF